MENQFDILEEIGRVRLRYSNRQGSFSRVYKARKLTSDKEDDFYALKYVEILKTEESQKII